ncbi:MAG TPA: lipoyl(octanoyl) transferase LipB [Chitinophagaceae bacterium]|nr:lipoyl(octanoyl) transferase LipB [Chitinophagaceae bacterium]
MKQEIIYQDLGEMPYQQAWDYQESLLQKNLSIKSKALNLVSSLDQPAAMDIKRENGLMEGRESTTNYLLFVEHPPVYTLGKSGKQEHVLFDETERERRGIEFFRTNRGGDITFHGPGQLVGYPIFDLENFFTDIGKYLRSLEEVIMLVLEDYGLKGDRSQGETGVWLDPGIKGRERKICAMGVRCSRWITMHGFAFNVNTDLSYFNGIIPCGIQSKQVTSLNKELGYEVPIGEVKEKLKNKFAIVFDSIVIDKSFH